MQNAKYTLDADQPKRNPWRHDRLGYRPTAERIAKTIVSISAPTGYVIGLHGQWGSGKSTMINFITQFILKHNAENEENIVLLLDFRPWMITGHHDLVTSFFKMLTEQLALSQEGIGGRVKGLLRYFHAGSDAVVDAAAMVALVAAPAGLPGATLAASAAKKGISSALGAFLKEPSLQLAYEKLKAQLAKRKQKILVTIDDIDRLEDEQVRVVMQMVKSIGQLPNVIYLLSYDKNLVWKTLNHRIEHEVNYGDKIVQQEIELPHPSRSALLSILDEHISFIPSGDSDDVRWHYILRDGVHRWIRRPRDVVRYANALKFAWPAFEGELDPQDFMAMEGLRLFDTETFNWIKNNRDLLFSEGRYLLAEDEDYKIAVENLKGQIGPDSLAPLMQVLACLFPQRGQLFLSGPLHSDYDEGEVERRRGIGCPTGFDTYFGLQLPADEVPRSEVDGLMQTLNDQPAIEHYLTKYIRRQDRSGTSMAAKALDQLRVRFRGSLPARPSQALLDALFRAGEEILAVGDDGQQVTLSARQQLAFTIDNILERWGPGEGGERLAQAFAASQSPAMMAEIFVRLGRGLGELPSRSPALPLISKEAFMDLGNRLLQVISVAAAGGTLEEAPYYFHIVTAWTYLLPSSDVAPREWLWAGIERDPSFMAKACQGIVVYSLSSQGRSYRLDLEAATKQFDLSALIQVGERHKKSDALSEDDRAIIAAVVLGARNALSGPLVEGGTL